MVMFPEWPKATQYAPLLPGYACYVKAKINVRRYGDGTLAIFHGPRCLARYNAAGKETKPKLKRAA